MLRQIGFIGVGHIAEYIVTGLAQTGENINFFFADPCPQRARRLAELHGGEVSLDNQMPVDQADLIILSTRPQQVESALQGLSFRPGQILASIAVGIPLQLLDRYVKPARSFRVLPISCVAVNQSPVLIYPENQDLRSFFSLLGRVHTLPDETTFEPATSLVGAFYAWIFALMEETVNWTAGQGLEPDLARKLVIETVQGACAMATAQDKLSLNQIWASLATPGGISEYGLRVINQKEGLKVWSDALHLVTERLRR